MNNMIKHLVEQNTFFHNAPYRHYLPYIDLLRLLSISSKKNKRHPNIYISHRFTIIRFFSPFNIPKEFQGRCLEIDIVNELTQESVAEFEKEKALAEEYFGFSDSVLHYHLVTSSDVRGFQRYLKDYLEHLRLWIPFMYEEIREEWNLTDSQLLIGSILFEVNCE